MIEIGGDTLLAPAVVLHADALDEALFTTVSRAKDAPDVLEGELAQFPRAQEGFRRLRRSAFRRNICLLRSTEKPTGAEAE